VSTTDGHQHGAVTDNAELQTETNQSVPVVTGLCVLQAYCGGDIRSSAPSEASLVM